MRKIPFISVVLFSLFVGLGFGQEVGYKVVCFGDSITKRGYPDILAKRLGIEVINAGVAGHTSTQGLRRMKKDVLEHKPNLVIVFFGTNDLRVDSNKHVPVKEYRKNLEQIAKACAEIKAEVVFCTPPPINEKTYFERHKRSDYDAHGGLSKLLGDEQEAVRTFGKEKRITVVDLAKELLKNPEWMHKDGVHPSPKGNVLIAEAVMRAIMPILPDRVKSAE